MGAESKRLEFTEPKRLLPFRKMYFAYFSRGKLIYRYNPPSAKHPTYVVLKYEGKLQPNDVRDSLTKHKNLYTLVKR